MNNVISLCYVIENKETGLEPIIYLTRPLIHPTLEKLYPCYTPFDAKRFLQFVLGDNIQIIICKDPVYPHSIPTAN